ncbi:uncharacterized protein LOC128327577 [Hemicordylus capensis]|uniref:uncharacterized protein LOC128327577 n=1 Tax=Hemicordylus capensis TaxID=884348 RepID=UPI0023028F1B|nr:uncharacterized protein LOC128327577 [Hemicordylus capensis]
MGGCWSCVACRSHPEAEPKDEDEEGALTDHPRNPTHVAPFSGGLPSVLGDTLGKELIEESSLPEPLPALHITNDILEEELTEEPSVPEPLPAPRITNDILEEELIEETSVPEPLPTPCITNDLLGKVLIEVTSVPGPSILTDTPKEAASVSEPLLEPSIAYSYLQKEVELFKGLQHDYVQQQRFAAFPNSSLVLSGPSTCKLDTCRQGSSAVKLGCSGGKGKVCSQHAPEIAAGLRTALLFISC